MPLPPPEKPVAPKPSAAAPKPAAPPPPAPAAPAVAAAKREPLVSEDAKKLGITPEHGEKFHRVAVDAFETGSFEDAEAAAFVAASADGNNPDYWLVLGLARAKQTKLNEAKAAFDRALELDPGNVGAWTNAGEVLIGLKDFAGAATALQKAISLDTTGRHPASMRARMLLVSKHQWKNGVSI